MQTSELIERLEQATGPDRELDAAIFALAFPDKVPSPIVESGYGWRFTGQMWWLETGEDSRCPRKTIAPPPYTASIDAALTLVPEGWRPTISQHIVPTDYWQVILRWWEKQVEGRASTPALAIVIAALRARSEGEG